MEGRQDGSIGIVLERIKINVSLHISNPVMRGNSENAKAKIKQVEGIARGS
jgi:predicted sugar kinase